MIIIFSVENSECLRLTNILEEPIQSFIHYPVTILPFFKRRYGHYFDKLNIHFPEMRGSTVFIHIQVLWFALTINFDGAMLKTSPVQENKNKIEKKRCLKSTN